ncbi:Der1-like family-domain-containing protein [Syncephalis plumigaleata]|nr:Der1-like family-domain-containing protein [Syncephalis plumigaleata]
MDLSEVRTWYTSLPVNTRFIFTATLAVPIVAHFNIVQPYWLVFIWSPIVNKFQLWRLVTSFFYNRLGFGLLMNLYFIYQHSMELETVTFAGRPADYAFFLLFCGIVSTIGAALLDLIVLNDSLVLAIVHYWSLRNSERIVNFMFGMRFKAKYLAAVLIGYELLISGGLPIGSLLGVAAAHSYHYLTNILPAQGGRRWLTTPALLQRWLPPTTGQSHRATTNNNNNGTGGAQSTGYSTARSSSTSSFTSDTASYRGQSSSSGRVAHNWGRGQRLGDN